MANLSVRLQLSFPRSTVFTLIGLLCLLPCSVAHSGTLSIISHGRWVNVASISDGDTFKTTKGERIRLLGINTPEVAHQASPAQPMGNTASKALSNLIAGTSVRLAFDEQSKDDYSRTLAQVYLSDGTWVNGEMIRTGMAHVYTFTPNLRWAAQLIQLEKSARKAKLGIWRTARFKMLDANKVTAEHLGQFRVISGQIAQVNRNGFGFRMGKLKISIPRKYRSYFNSPLDIKMGDEVVVHGVIRASTSGLYLPLHSPYDVENISP